MKSPDHLGLVGRIMLGRRFHWLERHARVLAASAGPLQWRWGRQQAKRRRREAGEHHHDVPRHTSTGAN